MSSRLHEIGRVGRPRGLDGWVRFEPISTLASAMLQVDGIVYVKSSRSGYRPLRIDEYYTEEKRNTQSFFVKFDMITNRTEAEEIKDRALYSDQFDPEENVDSIDDDHIDFSGYEIISDKKSIGSILDVMENPAHSILEAKVGKGLLLIPFVDEFVTEVDHDNRQIHCQNLDQLIED